jgi:O-methyltransferase
MERGFRFEHSGFSGFLPFRELRATGPTRDPEQLRKAYLDVLKLCLCDLHGTTAVSVWRDPERGMMSRELRGDDLQIRAFGVDWPLQGLTMVGLGRLDDLQSCVESIVADNVEGDLIEAGTWRGGASILMRATLDSLGDSGRRVWLADSFEGFPEPDDAHPDTERLAEVDYIAVPLEEVKANFERFGLSEGVEFRPGFFHETMPGLRGQTWSLVRLDGDSYEATWLTLQSLYPGLSVGGYLVIDDYGALEECRRAVAEFRDRHGIEEPIEEVDWTGVRWRRTDPTPLEDVDLPATRSTRNGNRSVPREQRERRVHVPHMAEVALRQQLAERDRELSELRESLSGRGLTRLLRRFRRGSA